MNLCACGCGQPAKKKYATRKCIHRVWSFDARSTRSKAWAKNNKAFYRMIGAKGNQKTRPTRWDDLLDKWLDDDVRPADALKACYERGYGAGYLAAQRHIRSKEAA